MSYYYIYKNTPFDGDNLVAVAVNEIDAEYMATCLSLEAGTTLYINKSTNYYAVCSNGAYQVIYS